MNMAPIFSYIIKYHSRIASVVVMLMTFGVLNKSTEPISSLFLGVHYEQVTDKLDQSVWKMNYGTGLKDIFSVCLWFLVGVIMKAFIHDNVLKKIHHKFQLSKSGKSKFFESGQLTIFNVVSIIWTLTIIINIYSENLSADFSLLLTGHQQNTMSFLEKLFYINQLAYWAHVIPELYCQKMKKKETFGRVKYSVLNLALILILYISNFYCIGVLVLLFYNISEFTKHAFKLIVIIKMKGEVKKAHLARSVYRWLFFIIQSLTLVLPKTVSLYNDINDMELSGKLHDFKSLLSGVLPIVGVLIIQFWIIYEFSSDQKPNGLNISRLFCLCKSKNKADIIKNSSNKKRENAVYSKLYIPTEIKKGLKKGVKKHPRNNA